MWFLCSFTFSIGQQGLGLSAPQMCLTNSSVKGFLIPASNSQIPVVCLTIQLNSAISQKSIRFHSSGAQSCKTAPLFTPLHTHFRHLLCFSQANYSSEVPRNSSLGSINLLEQLTELRKPVYYQITDSLQRILKDTNQQPDEEI